MSDNIKQDVEAFSHAITVADHATWDASWGANNMEEVEEAFKQLRAYRDEYASLHAEAAAMRPIVEAVAVVSDDDYDEACPFCRQQPGYTSIEHDDMCPVTKARAYIAEHPGT